MDPVYAQTTAPAAGAPASLPPDSPLAGLFSMLPFILIAAVFYFLILRPQGKETKRREEMVKNLQRGDKVLTRGGLYGTVADLKENVVVLKVNENSKVEVNRSYVESVEKAP
ncbi:MAG TPA: preprotein translocase subunit YajC [bacterium]|nr:preprotein translocase subunit YajC [bacterium]